jgi:hypothetical protein
MDRLEMLSILRQIDIELKRGFDDWDFNTQNDRPVVTIQDLDYWAMKLKDVIIALEKEE